jgi:DASS family divalent anion:Na+ symporter
MAAAITKVGLMRRLAIYLLKCIPPNLSLYNWVLSLAGVLVTLLLPNVKSRMAIAAPVTDAISKNLEFQPRSNASAALALATYVGFSQMSFMFLTGMSSNLIGWNLMPAAAREEFGWGLWLVAALPAGFVTLLFLLSTILFCFPPEPGKEQNQVRDTFTAQFHSLGPLSASEWMSAIAISVAVAGWLTKPLHGIGEAWVALGCFLFLLVSGVLDKDDIRRHIDWSLMIFFGVISSLGDIVRQLKSRLG